MSTPNDTGKAVVAVYEGSDADATRALYARLFAVGVAGAVAVNLLRASKASARAKLYRGGNSRGRYRDQAYEKKAWALDQLAMMLTRHAAELSIAWGWGVDPAQEYHVAVLYVELPNGQVSFHAATRGEGPDAPRPWDGARGMSAGRICAYAAAVLDGVQP